MAHKADGIARAKSANHGNPMFIVLRFARGTPGLSGPVCPKKGTASF